MHDIGYQDIAGCRDHLQASGNIDAIAEQIHVFSLGPMETNPVIIQSADLTIYEIHADIGTVFQLL